MPARRPSPQPGRASGKGSSRSGKGAPGRKGAGRDAGAGKPGPTRVVLATNRRARHTYQIQSSIEAGLVLVGSEVRSLRGGKANIAEGYAQFRDGDLWLLNVHIQPLAQAATFGHEPLRPRKCLLHRAELHKLHAALEAPGATVVPLSLYFLGGRVKVELGLALGRRKGDRREREKEKEARRDIREASR